MGTNYWDDFNQILHGALQNYMTVVKYGRIVHLHPAARLPQSCTILLPEYEALLLRPSDKVAN